MSSIITEEKTKEILTEILIEMMQNKRELFYEIVIEALEDIGLANAITEGLMVNLFQKKKFLLFSMEKLNENSICSQILQRLKEN